MKGRVATTLEAISEASALQPFVSRNQAASREQP